MYLLPDIKYKPLGSTAKLVTASKWATMEWISFPLKKKIYLGYFSATNFATCSYCLWHYHSWYYKYKKILSHDWIIKIIQEVILLMFTVPKNHNSSIINVCETFTLSHPNTAITVHFKYLPLKIIEFSGKIWNGKEGRGWVY